MITELKFKLVTVAFGLQPLLKMHVALLFLVWKFVMLMHNLSWLSFFWSLNLCLIGKRRGWGAGIIKIFFVRHLEMPALWNTYINLSTAYFPLYLLSGC